MHRLIPDHPHAYLYESGYPCGGVCVGDVNGDQLPDLVLINGPDENALFLNRGDFRFERDTNAVVVADGGNWGVSGTLADLDGDGDLDLLLANYGAQNKILLNDGHGVFRDVTAASGMAYAGPSQEIYAADFDGDGDLDLFLLTNRFYSRNGRPRGMAYEAGPDGRQKMKKEYAPFFRIVRPDVEIVPLPGTTTDTAPPAFMLEYGHPDRLYRNDGLGADGVPHFTDVTMSTPLAQVAGHGLSALIWDVNGDHLPDIYVANDYTDSDCLWLNMGTNSSGVFQFRDAIEDFLPYTSWSSMGSDLTDVDGDGRMDFMVADMAGSTHSKHHRTTVELVGWRRWVAQNGWPRQTMRNTLFLGSGVGRFEEAAFEAGVARTDWTWAVKFGDYDLDGRPDVFLTTGAARLFTDADILVEPSALVGKVLWDTFRPTAEGREQNFAFKNLDGLHFGDVSRDWGVGALSMSYGAATADLDRDGDLDLVVCNLTENVSLYRNTAVGMGNHWLKVRLQGVKNTRGIGAQVTVTTSAGKKLARYMNPQTGYLSGNEPMLHFGLGTDATPVALEVVWPGGTRQNVMGVKVDQECVVEESKAVAESAGALQPLLAKTQPWFEAMPAESGLVFEHRETAFNDYERERLLPAKLSQSGPGMAVADVNGDGLEDVFVAGGMGQNSVLFIQQPAGRFVPLANPPWTNMVGSEVLTGVFLDVDRDGDLDLYVVTGSNEREAGDVSYRDRLFLNQREPGQSEVRFVEANAGALPDLREAGSCVTAFDFDLDGDLDLFVGSRGVPGHYGQSGSSVLLRNDSNGGEVRFSEVTDIVAPGLKTVGMVTGALASDVDGDGKCDLWVLCEWDAPVLFQNQNGKLVRQPNVEGLFRDKMKGWWNGIVGGDVDGDGDMDYLMLNAGTNTKYGAPDGVNPVVLYSGDMDGNESVELVEGMRDGKKEWPVRARFSALQAVPLLGDRFPTYQSYSVATLADIYGEEVLKHAVRFEVNELRSGVLVNESTAGKLRFSWKPLPARAQLSPGYGAALGYFRPGVGFCAWVAQNSYAREMETGLWRGGFGIGLRFGSREGSGVGMEMLAPEMTGWEVSGDGKAVCGVDLNGDHLPDLLVSQNNGRFLPLLNRGEKKKGWMSLALVGAKGNPQAVGARVTVSSTRDGKALGVWEVTAGGGYLSHSSSVFYWSAPEDVEEVKVSVKWPLGQRVERVLRLDGSRDHWVEREASSP